MEVLIQEPHYCIPICIAYKTNLSEKSPTLQVTSPPSPNHCILYFPIFHLNKWDISKIGYDTKAWLSETSLSQKAKFAVLSWSAI